MALIYSSQGDVLFVELPTRLVMGVAPEVRNEIKDLITQRSARIVLDLREVEFVDSSGLSVLISTLNSAKAVGGDVVLLGPRAPVRSLIELTRLHHVFQIFDAPDAAAAALG